MPIPAALLAGLLLLPPDIIPEGVRSIAVQSRADAKAVAAQHCLGYVLKKGDTLIALARTQLGDETRWREIAALNPSLDPDKLQVGATIWLPPRDVAATKKELVFAYWGTGHLQPDCVYPLVDGGEIRGTYYGSMPLFLVNASAQKTFEAAFGRAAMRAGKAPETTIDALVKDGKLTPVTGSTKGRHVPVEDPTARREDTYVIEKGADGKFAVRVTSVAYGKDGKVIAGGMVQPSLWFLLLASAGGGVLLRRAGAGRRWLAALA